MSAIPAAFHDLFEKETIAHVSTLLPNGAPHVTPVWIDYDADADRLLVNTERGRRKEKNVRNDPRVAVSMTDPDDAYRMVSVTGSVHELTTDGARDHIDELTRRYMDREEYPNEIETERVIVSIEPENVSTFGPE
ncbi:pyridoxamine 5'-phosphate oxidase family protein [Halobiforma nitratireducens]|uniref:Pyridoxamine 5'-phosphate oxidase N-terminal domain-containing protein n=1 Tax=Halobiforma nitratireducens JCM 10879 TaxID=1227454 RepID=M0MM86_9EURY|nr:TIGR03618 family F420-dependent PPOX class oxidoreductase [Halobiforma nitratireducens]EMA45530.1 hypothetical protein C446_02135 [Halobiforma nitratireducens JCM 10879]